MKVYHTFDNGAYVVVTTRRANYATQIFAKASMYPSRADYDKLNLRNGYCTFENYYMCDNPADLPTAVENFIKSLAPLTIARHGGKRQAGPGKRLGRPTKKDRKAVRRPLTVSIDGYIEDVLLTYPGATLGRKAQAAFKTLQPYRDVKEQT